LIYLDTELQDRVIPIFHYALVHNGILMLGSSETISHHENLFDPLDRPHRIFVRRDGPSDVSSVYRFAAGDARPGTGVAHRPDPKAHWSKAVAFANRRVLERFTSPFVVVNAAGEIAHFSSHMGRFLEPAAGAPTTNLFQMARQGWALELHVALRRCVEMGRPVEHARSAIAGDGEKPCPVKLVVEPLPSPDSEAAPSAMVPETDAAVAQLDRENRDLREQLQSIAEEHATAIEELRSSNEELQSVNEELQSTNEELETSREEIQSINEELNTVNVQLSAKVDELDQQQRSEKSV
jgi:two-component system CheB/CheR fusion protein